MLITYDKFNLRIAKVIRLSFSIAMIMLIAALIMYLMDSVYVVKVATIGVILIVLTPVNAILTVLIFSIKRKRYIQLVLTAAILACYIISIIIAL